MTFSKKFFYILLLGFSLFVADIFISAVFFRTIENKFEGKVLKEISLPGAEDITISQIDSFAIVSSTYRKNLNNSKQENAGLYFIDLKTGIYNPIHLTKNFKKPFGPQGISMLKKDSIYLIAAINHTKKGAFIEVFNFSGKKLTQIKTLKNEFIFSPNDLVLSNEKRFYFTNDHKYKEGFNRFAEDYIGLGVANVVFFNGENYTEVANGIVYANGINFDKKRNFFLSHPLEIL
jgi:arylesterase/paraoxonase